MKDIEVDLAVDALRQAGPGILPEDPFAVRVDLRRMLGARTPAGRLAVAMSALGDSVQALHMSVACLNREAVYMSALRS